MNCRKIQEYLKSDYLDKEAKPELNLQIEKHLAGCAKCRRLKELLLSERALFQGAGKENPPERIWQNVRNAIISESLAREKSSKNTISERLRQLILFPRPVFAVAGACAVIVFIIALGTTLINKNQGLNKTGAEEILAGYSLNTENGGFLYELGTNIEEYFL